MPIHERDPWRRAYFAATSCPADIDIPTDDADAYRWNPSHRWVYNKLRVVESQGLECAPHGIQPTHYPVFSKPIFNLDGMGLGSRLLRDADAYELHRQPGHMWMTYLVGQHISTDTAVVDGMVHWMGHARGLPLSGGLFDYWTIEEVPRADLEAYCTEWIRANLAGYTGMVNFETIGGRIIEVHLRVTDQWPDLYGAGWLEAVVQLYCNSTWNYREPERRRGYSVALFGPHGRTYSHPDDAVLGDVAALPGVSSVQITFHNDQPALNHAMPPGGFRLAVINAWDLAAGFKARERLTRAFGLNAPFTGSEGAAARDGLTGGAASGKTHALREPQYRPGEAVASHPTKRFHTRSRR